VHAFALPEPLKESVRRRTGKEHPFDRIDGRRTALLVVDMQNYFCEPGQACEIPLAREIVPNINRLAAALRAAGGLVAWVQATYTRSGPGYWALFFDHMVSPELSAEILDGLTEGSPGHALWHELDVQPGDLRARKNRYSAFFPGASELPQLLRSRSIDTVLIAGTMTNVCCEASARDAMMDGFRTIVVSDANAARSDAEHTASLATILQFFGDVRSTDEVIGLLRK
jgi:ureidoacrylate peracid hydrolase